MKNPAEVLPDTAKAVQGLIKAVSQSGVAQSTLELVHLRASQINGCGFCVDYGVRSAGKAGETTERLFAVAAWRESPCHRPPTRGRAGLVSPKANNSHPSPR